MSKLKEYKIYKCIMSVDDSIIKTKQYIDALGMSNIIIKIKYIRIA